VSRISAGAIGIEAAWSDDKARQGLGRFIQDAKAAAAQVRAEFDRVLGGIQIPGTSGRISAGPAAGTTLGGTPIPTGAGAGGTAGVSSLIGAASPNPAFFTAKIESLLGDILLGVRSIASASGGPGTGAGTGAGGSKGGTGGSTANFFTRGFDRLVGAGFLLRGAENIYESSVEYGRDRELAGGDPRAQIAADFQYRSRLTAFPFAGRLADIATDPGGLRRTEIERTLRQASEQDRNVALARQGREFFQSFSRQTEVATARGDDARRIQLEQERQGRVNQIQEETKTQAQRISTGLQTRIAEADRYQNQIDQAAVTGGHADPDVFAAREKEAQRQRDAANAEADKQRRTLDEQRRRALEENDKRNQAQIDELNRVRTSRVLGLGTEIQTSALRAQNRPFEAQLAGIAGGTLGELATAPPNEQGLIAFKGLSRIIEAGAEFYRTVRRANIQSGAEERVTRALLNRDPLGAGLARIAGQREEALEAAPGGLLGTFLRPLINRRFAGQETLFRQQFRDQQAARLEALTGERAVTGLEAQLRPQAAAIENIRTETSQRVRAFRRQGQEQEAQLAIDIGLNRLAAFNAERDFGARPEEANPFLIARGAVQRFTGQEAEADVQRSLAGAQADVGGLRDQKEVADKLDTSNGWLQLIWQAVTEISFGTF
jgi:hypothetical protein